jgi:hypothetical protein
MITTIKKILPYFLVSIFVAALWWFLTRIDNYAWFPQGKELLMLGTALSSIFYYKMLFWLVISNVAVFFIQQLTRKNYKTTIITAIATIIFYFTVEQVVDKKCAFHYYLIFKNQSVSEEYIDRPILQAGYPIGPILTQAIVYKEMSNRRYAIGGLGKINYIPAIQTLQGILLDKTEKEFIRADAFMALANFDTDKTRKITTNFIDQATDTLDKKVVKLVNYKH